MKKLLSIVLAFIIVLSVSVVPAFADGFDGVVAETFDVQVVGDISKIVISWEDVKDAEYYKVCINSSVDYYDVDETVNDNFYDWGANADITPDMPFDVIVYAYDKNGSIVAHSDVVTFYVVVVMCDYWGYYGDVDDDRMITVIDATYVQKYLAMCHTFDYFKSHKADADADGKISIIDATYIQLYCAEIYNEKSRIGQDLWVGAVKYEILFEKLW